MADEANQTYFMRSDYVCYLSFIKYAKYGEMFQIKITVLLCGTDLILFL